MTAPATGELGGDAGKPGRSTTTRDAAGAILLVLALGLTFRIILALALSGSGFGVDLQAFRFWAGNLADQGPFGFYGRDFFHDYTPGYLYILWLVGIVGRLLGGIGDLIKIPAIVADIGLGWLVWSMAREMGAGRRAAILGGAIVIANPITWFDSVVWGQVDSVGVVFLLLAVRELWRDRLERSAVLAVVAAIIKPQLGILVPIVAAVTIRRALWPEGGHGDEPGVRRFEWERRVRGPIRIVTTGAAGLLTAVLLSAGFGLSIFDLVRQVGTAAATYPYLTVNAYNPWALLDLNGTGLAANGQWVCDMVIPPAPRVPACLEAFQFGPIPALVVGTVLLVATLVIVTIVVARRPDRRTILVGVAVLALAFFVVPTRVHERYLYPFFALAAILAAVSVRWRASYVLLSVATFANLYVVLTTLYPGNPRISDWLGIGPSIRTAPGVAIIALVHLAGFVWAGLQLRQGALETLEAEIRDSAEDDSEADAVVRQPMPVAAPVPASAALVSGAAPAARALTSAVQAPAAVLVPRRYELPTWTEAPAFGEARLGDWLRSRFLGRPARPDRTATLRREGGGRLDRLDLWLVAVLVLAALTIRVWRLGEPYRMHFDEVYHARTATEFLQYWRYGLSHDIYEWTHPHLAKYAMAGGLVAWGGDHVAGTAELGVPVGDAVVELRWENPDDRLARLGDRLHVATGTEVRSYDLRTRELVARAAVPGATRLALDQRSHRLYVATADGGLFTVELAALDEARRARAGEAELVAVPFASLPAPARLLHVTDDGSAVFVALDGDTLVALDPGTGAELGGIELPGIAGLDDGGATSALVARPSAVVDPPSVAAELEKLLGGAAADYEQQLTDDRGRVVIAGVEASGETRTAIDAAITENRLTGVGIENVPRVAVATEEGVAFVSSSDASVVQRVDLEGGAQGLALVEGIDDPKLYVTTDGPDGPQYRTMTVGGSSATGTVTAGQAWPLPGRGSVVRWDAASQQVHVLGAPPAGRPADQVAAVYVIEPHANAVYADAPLAFEPAALVLDANELFPSSDREDVLALSTGGAVATVDAGSHAFAWRLPGVLAGILMAALLYLLARILFARRSVAVLVGALVLVDGMLFVQSRIGMNDAYVALAIVAAYTIFAALWTGAWRGRWAFWVGMPSIGLLLGLALASKWVAAYAIGALGILILARSALGRVVLVAGMILVTTVLGYIAVSVPEGQTGNLTFMLIMIGLTMTAAVVSVLHPIAWSTDEVRFAVGAPAAAGVGLVLLALAAGQAERTFTFGPLAGTPLHLGFALVVLGIGAAAGFWLAAKAGFGPLAGVPAPDDPARLLEPPAPAAEGWLRPGWALGIPAAWIVLSLLAIPVAVYIASYIPWSWIENHRIWEGWPAGHTGQSLSDLTGQMYTYHNNLSSGHAASSPWWAWPFDLKPVWFYQASFAGGTAGAIYDAGNLVLWWLGIPAMAFCCWQAFRRRSLPLALIAIGFACQWVAWARIDRAAFQYHYYTSLPFVALALAYFLAELWHGASRRTWLLARLAGAAAVLAPAAMWLFHRPLCGFVRVEAAAPGSQACPTVIPEFVLTVNSLGIAIVVVVALIVLIRLMLALDRGDDPGSGSRLGGWPALLLSALAAGIALLAADAFLPETPLTTLRNVAVEPIAILVLVPLAGAAFAVVSARDARRFTLGVLSAIMAFFVIWYPNLTGLPLPSNVMNAYQGFLPTYLYPFQFPVSTVDRNIAGPAILSLGSLMLLAALTVACVILAYSAWVWRIALAERELDEAAGPEAGTGPALGTSGG